jgi:hypothetical protein
MVATDLSNRHFCHEYPGIVVDSIKNNELSNIKRRAVAPCSRKFFVDAEYQSSGFSK